MFGWRTGVVTQACQREINAAGVKMRQRGKLCRMVDPVGGFIPNLRQLGGREVARQASAHGAVQRQFGTINHIRIGDLMARWLDGDVGTVILIQQRQLFFQIRAKQRRAGDGGGVAASVGKACIGAGLWRIGGATIPGH